MKKIQVIISLIFTLFTLVSCDTQINSTLYVSSIGISTSDGKVIISFLSNPLTDISRNKNEDDKEPEVLKIESDSVYAAFNEASLSLLTPLNFKHIKTVIIHKDVFDTKYVNEFLEYVKSVRYISYNFYVFSTLEEINEIYNFKNPEQISYQYSILSSPDLLDYTNFGVDRLHFLDFSNRYLVKERYLHIPMLVLNTDWNKHKTLEVNGLLAIDDVNISYKNEDYPGMLYLKNKNTILYYDGDDIYRVNEYKVGSKIDDGVYVILISYTNILSYYGGSREKFEEKISIDIKKYLDTYILNHNKLYMIEFYNYLNNTNLNTINYELEIIYKA